MLALQVVSSINMAIPIVEAVFLKPLKKTKDNMTMKEKFSGLQELVFSSEAMFIKNFMDLTMIFLPIRRKLICAGVL